jgi:hypothetical protein
VNDARPADRPRSAPARAVIALIGFYRTAISPIRPPACRYTPSCSAYAVEAIERFGLMRGTWLALRRLSRCHPFHQGGHDPVPPAVDPDVGNPSVPGMRMQPRSS